MSRSLFKQEVLRVGIQSARCRVEQMKMTIMISENKEMESRQRRQGNLESARQTADETRENVEGPAAVHKRCNDTRVI